MEPATKTTNDRSLEARALSSKLAGLNAHLKVLLQKKIRLDIEIRRTQRRLSRLKQNSTSVLKISAAVEQFTTPEYTPFIRALLSSLEKDDLQDALTEFEEISAEVQRTLETLAALEGYLVPENFSF